MGVSIMWRINIIEDSNDYVLIETEENIRRLKEINIRIQECQGIVNIVSCDKKGGILIFKNKDNSFSSKWMIPKEMFFECFKIRRE